MKNNNFQLFNNVEKTYWYVNDVLINVPNKELPIKKNIDKYFINIIELVFSYQLNTSSKLKVSNLKNILINLSMIDFFVVELYRRKALKKKKYESICNFLLNIKKITFGILKNEDN